jgi:hypothetical protein
VKYEPTFSPRAVDVYNSLPLSILDEFDAHIDRLADNPPAVAVPGAFPFPANRMIYHFEFDDFEGQTWYFAVHFRYVVDEISLNVIAITVQHSD